MANLCPNSGKKYDSLNNFCQIGCMQDPIAEAQARLQSLFGLSATAAERAVAEVLDCFASDVTEYVQARHKALQGTGASNARIYERIVSELPRLRFAAPNLSARQIRRCIYG
jgi:hypothetical protein